MLGSVAGILTTIAFFPQVFKVITTKSTHDISLFMFLIMAIGIFLWFLYGLFINALPVILANFISLFLATIILVYKLKYK
ncbi:MAG: SemiSWEET transporter [Calditrichaceae bacterium]|nr:SemiSWEET transporter [Calditrichaceae bacterium]MBN2707626.1 SemiSWEET transporter [Calditrichaceae bacterium]RQV93232.1 MAG: hypothetical protein EH224_12970 [Calditrichota bacterium]